MASIGGITVSAMRGTILEPMTEVQTFTRPGVAGLGLIIDSAHPKTVEIETDHYGTAANIGTFVGSAVATIGTSVTVVDQFGSTWTDVAVLDLSYSIFVAKGMGGSNTHIVRARWTLAATT